MSIDLLAALAAGYLLGSLPVAQWVARAKGRDIFTVGSGNMGAMNTARNVGWGAGLVVLLGDVGKGTGAALAGGAMAVLAGATEPLYASLAAGTGAVIGHAWSCFAGLRGGKALATLLGAFLPVAPLVAGLGAALMVGLALLLRRGAPAAVVTLLLYPLVAGSALLNAGWDRDRAFAVTTAAAATALVSLLKHALAARAQAVARRNDEPRE